MHEAMAVGKLFAGTPGALPLRGHPLAIVGVDRLQPAIAQNLIEGKPGQLLQGPVGVGAATAGIGAHQAQRGGVVHRLQFGGLGAQLAFDPLPVGHIMGQPQYHLFPVAVDQAIVIAPDPQLIADQHRHQALVRAPGVDAAEVGVDLVMGGRGHEPMQPPPHHCFRGSVERRRRRRIHRLQHAAQRMGADQAHAVIEDVAIATLAFRQLAA